jgi:hypothetical protein
VNAKVRRHDQVIRRNEARPENGASRRETA